MSKHSEFIKTPIINVLQEMISGTSCLGSGIETYPLWDYVLQSTFIKMTGFMEQKLSCIDWELATNGYEYRWKFLNNKSKYSSYDGKNSIYNGLIGEISRFSGEQIKDIIIAIKQSCSLDANSSVCRVLKKSLIIYARQRDYDEIDKENLISKNDILLMLQEGQKKANLLGGDLKDHYEELYNQRNRIAHNTLSYQKNIPGFNVLKDKGNLDRNYFYWFTILVLLDEIFVKLYEKYEECLRRYSYFEY